MDFVINFFLFPIPLVSYLIVGFLVWLGYRIRNYDKDLYIEMLEEENQELRKNHRHCSEERN